ncbi:uncharacterized protein LOC123195594 [Mangifera indica]|uniref:uncharacterized protein LOC123195594 n=1 Tax=Mangifera indica TaxID=29780 RepID=UPI001CF9D3D4|nr:uncharacterized protein LOC123195594 [Mangifera indica]
MEQPSSPGTNPVEISRCIEEIVKFTLESHMKQNLQLDLALSKDFCSFLLRHVPVTSDSCVKESQYPLYKRLATALYELITCAAASNGTFSKNQDNELVLKEGSELVELLKAVNFELHVQEPYFTQLKDGLKTVEGRCAVGDYSRIGPGALILFNKCLVLEVQDVERYGSFYEMLQAQSLAKVLPGIKSIVEGVQVYRKFYTEEKEQSNGVLAICVAKWPAQPFFHIARILNQLSYEGLQSLLGLNDHN